LDAQERTGHPFEARELLRVACDKKSRYVIEVS
jgi:hypothetical protein